MQTKDITPIIASSSVGSTTKRINEDAAFHFSQNNEFHIAVADGVGSASHGKEAANFVIDQLQSFIKDSSTEISKHYQSISNSIKSFNETEEYETTLISFHSTQSKKFHLYYTGNGCILHLKGNFWQQKIPSHVPFNLVNLLSPHTLLENGKEVLYNYFSNKKDMEISTSELVVSPDPFFGDIFIIGTDGFFSADQIKIGKNKSGTWQQISYILTTFFEKFIKLFEENNPIEEDQVSHFINEFLNNMQANSQLEDDTSIGIFISENALKYHQKQNALHE